MARGGRRAKRSRGATVYDVANRAGVSIATVSRVLREPERVTEATRAAVLAAVDELSYAPRASARGLAAGHAGVIGLYFAGFDPVEEPDPQVMHGGITIHDDPSMRRTDLSADLYMSALTRGALTAAWKNNTAIMIAIPAAIDEASRLVSIAGSVDGLVAMSRSIGEEALLQISRRIPLVVIAGGRTDDQLDHVTTNNRAGMTALTCHVLQVHGVTNVGYLGGPADSPDDVDRFAGFQDALASAQLPIPERPLERGDFTRPSGQHAVRALAEQDRLPRALLCGNDQMALGALDVLRAIGKRVPDDVIVTGFDGIEATQFSIPRLTTVHQPTAQLGMAAVDLLLKRLAEPDREPQSVMLGVDVLIRESCGCHRTDTTR